MVDQMVNSQVVGIVDLHGIPAAQMISMRAGLRGKAEVSMTRNTLMDLAITEAAKKRPGLEQLRRLVEGQCAIVTTDENPFKLFRQMEGTKTPAPAKPGDIAPEDIMVKAGDTPFKPAFPPCWRERRSAPAGAAGSPSMPTGSYRRCC